MARVTVSVRVQVAGSEKVHRENSGKFARMMPRMANPRRASRMT